MRRRPDLAERNRSRTVHGLSRSTTYVVWRNMKSRCLNSKDKDYPRYGGRGIEVCLRWISFAHFLEDMGERPTGMQLDRYPNNNGNYEPSNCRWTSPRENSNNRRSCRSVAYQGKTMTIAQWARELGIGPKTLRYRLEQNWPLGEVMNMPANKANKWKRIVA